MATLSSHNDDVISDEIRSLCYLSSTMEASFKGSLRISLFKDNALNDL